jgi:hypothetical protein
VLAALNHEEPDRVPIDLAGTGASGIVLDAYDRLKVHLGLEHETKIRSKLNQVADPDCHFHSRVTEHAQRRTLNSHGHSLKQNSSSCYADATIL